MSTNGLKYYSITDARWSEAKVEPYNCNTDTDEGTKFEEASFDEQQIDLTCTCCKALVGEDRSDLITHYKSDWHRHNLRRILQGRPLLTEDEFEQKISNEDDVSSLDTESDEEVMPFSGGVHAYFTSEGIVYSIYRCILPVNEIISADLFNRPLDCVIILLSGGHFCGGIFENNNLVAHKSFHRYVSRAKQGTMQSASDARGNVAKSAGAKIRRHNEKALKDDVQNLLAKWSEMIERSPLIFMRCPTLQRQIFFEKTKNFKLEKTDERLRSIPFETHRPTMEELQKTWSRLKIVRSHGSLDDFQEEIRKRTVRRKKQKRLFQRKISEGATHQLLSDSSETSEENVKVREPLQIVNAQNEESNAEQNEVTVSDEIVTKANARALYSAIRLNSISDLHRMLDANNNKREDLLKYIREIKFPPISSTFLHIAARRGTVEILEELMLLGCDPTVKDDDGKVPYQVAQNRAVRQAFSKFRSEHQSAFDWKTSQVPEIALLSEELLLREAEKKRIQREKKKQRCKAKKAAQKQEKFEQEQCQKYLTLSDQEKRELVAERRIPASLQTLAQVVENDGNRCFKCGVILDGKPFEYSDNRFCSLPCLQTHRKENAAQKISR